MAIQGGNTWKILLGLTGSVATVLYRKIIEAIRAQGYDVDVIATESARNFWDSKDAMPFCEQAGVRFFVDANEWEGHPGRAWGKGDSILHIELRDKYSALVIAPCSANTLAKIANGLCDNLLTSVARAWDPCRPFIIAPAMNTQMWDHPITARHLGDFARFSTNNRLVPPQTKMLACGTLGMGAMADIDGIVKLLSSSLRWKFPLHGRCEIPYAMRHPGAFAALRNGHRHTGVDLYCEDGENVYAVEHGVVVNVEHFTGPQDASPWWEDTECVMVRGATGVVNYGEVGHVAVCPGQQISRGDLLAKVKRAIRPGKEHPEITGWKPAMLHLELYPHDATKASDGFEESLLRDPTPFLIGSLESPKLLYLARKVGSDDTR